MTTTQTPAAADRRKKLMIGAGIAVVLLAVLGFVVYWFVFRDDAPAAVDSIEAAEARQEALAEAQEDPPAAEDTEVDTEPAAEEQAATDDISGTWNIDTSIGTFGELCLTEVCDATFVGFRIDEELASIGAKTVVGRTPGVTGTMTIDGTTITATDILVDMTGLITDDDSRNNAIRNQAIETAVFPEASFALTQPIELGAVPGPGEQVQCPVRHACGD